MTTVNEWSPVALSASIEAGTSSGALLDGAEIVVWRDSKGAAHVWEDRCPHRGMRMSFGFVRGDRVACLYHGWEYDTAGQCQYIPAHPNLEVPKTIKVATYASEEKSGLIWARLAEGADGSAAPDLGALTPVRSIYADVPSAAVEGVLENATPAASRVAGAVGCWALEGAGVSLVVALQPLSKKKTGLHVLISGAADAAARKAVARWAEAFRLALENPAFASATAEFA